MRQVEEVAWQHVKHLVCNPKLATRYAGLKASLRLLASQVSTSPSGHLDLSDRPVSELPADAASIVHARKGVSNHHHLRESLPCNLRKACLNASNCGCQDVDST